MARPARTIAFVAVLGLSVASSAQIGLGEVGFQLISNNVAYGTVCPRTFSCTYVPADIHRGQNAEFIVRGVFNQWFITALWFDVPHQCLSVPGFHNQLFATMFFEPFFGVLTQRDPALLCPGGMVRLPFTVPQGLPVGAAVTLQALAYSYLNGNEVPTFTQAIRATVR